jgi:hypothetical protein
MPYRRQHLSRAEVQAFLVQYNRVKGVETSGYVERRRGGEELSTPEK